MEVTWRNFDKIYDSMFEKVWQTCFLLTASVKAADDHCFRTFLVLGSAKNADYPDEPDAAPQILLHACGELARRWYAQKPRRRLTRRYLDKYPLTVPVTDEVLAFLHLSLNRRLTSVASSWGMSGDRLRHAVGLRLKLPKPAALPDLTGIEPDP